MSENSAVQSEQLVDAKHASLKRRGLIAGAAALVAGLLATKTPENVVALNGDNLIIGNTGTPTGYQSATAKTELVGTITAAPILQILNGFSGSADSDQDGIQGYTIGADDAGIFGRNNDSNGVGVWGEAPGGTGAFGDSGNGSGVAGNSTSGAGVFGISYSGIGVQGESTSSYGVHGHSVSGIGAYGQTDTAGQYGILGVTNAPSAIAIGGIATADGASSFSGGTSNPNAYAGYFQGHVVVAGSFDVSPMGNKHGLAAHPDGTYRTFYSVESTECWVEDFGEAIVTNGKADVKFGSDFAELVHTDTYHVFVMEHGGYSGLHTTKKDASGFMVEASEAVAKAAGLNSVGQVQGKFSYRVVAKPKTTAKVDRLAKVTLQPPALLDPKTLLKPKDLHIPNGRPTRP